MARRSYATQFLASPLWKSTRRNSIQSSSKLWKSSLMLVAWSLLAVAVVADEPTKLPAAEPESQLPWSFDDPRLEKLAPSARGVTLYWLRMHEATHARFVISGTIVDETGKLLDDATVEVSASRGGILQRKATRLSQKVVAKNGIFDITLDQMFGVEYSFVCQGYYTEWITLVNDLDKKDMDRVLAGNRITGRSVERKNVRVVLQKKGELTHLYHFGPTVTVEADGSGRVIDFGRVLGRKGLEADVVQVGKSDKMPKGCLWIGAGHNADGTIKLAPRANDDDQKEGRLPAILNVAVNDPEGGIILADNEPTSDKIFRAFRKMTRAPENEYHQQLSLSPGEYQDRRCFYFKTQGRYGKACIEWVKADPKQRRVSAQIRVKYQRQASRNLEDGV